MGIYIIIPPAKNHGSLPRSRQEDHKSQRWQKTTSELCLLNTAGYLNIRTYSGYDNMYKISVCSSQTKFYHGSRNVHDVSRLSQEKVIANSGAKVSFKTVAPVQSTTLLRVTIYPRIYEQHKVVLMGLYKSKNMGRGGSRTRWQRGGIRSKHIVQNLQRTDEILQLL